MKIRLLRSYSVYHTGRVIDCEDETARRLIVDGIAERAEGSVETATVEHVVEQADATPRKIKRAIQKPENTEESGS